MPLPGVTSDLPCTDRPSSVDFDVVVALVVAVADAVSCVVVVVVVV